MTNDEAASMMSRLKNSLAEYCGLNKNGIRAFDLAIKALEAQDATDTNVGDMISRQTVLDAIDQIETEIANGEWDYAKWRRYFCELPPAQPEPEWGLPVSINRPLSDREIIPRLRAIQRQIGGSYAIDRAIELIKALAERRTDERKAYIRTAAEKETTDS